MSKPFWVAGQYPEGHKGGTTSNSQLLRGVLTPNQRFGIAAQFIFILKRLQDVHRNSATALYLQGLMMKKSSTLKFNGYRIRNWYYALCGTMLCRSRTAFWVDTMFSQLKALLLFVYALCLFTIAGHSYAWNDTDILLSPQQHSDQVVAGNDSSSSYYSDDEMPDMWKKPRGYFVGTLGEILMTLPLFNRMDREAAQQKWSYIVSFPLKKKGEKPEVSTDQSVESPDQTATSSAAGSSINNPNDLTGSNDGQPPNQELIQHTHGACCHASGCNGGRCQCKECSTNSIELPTANKIKVDGSTDEKKDQPVANVLKLSRQRKVKSTPLASSSQDRLSSGIHEPVCTYNIDISRFATIHVLPNGQIVSFWSDSETLTVHNLMPQVYSNAQFSADHSTSTHSRNVYEITSTDFITDTHARESSLSQIANNSHLVPLLGHTKEICGVFVKRDGRIVTWSKDQTIRVWTEQNGYWSSVKTEVDKNIDYAWSMRELIDGRLLFYNPSSRVTLVLSDHGYGWEYETINNHIGELRDGRLYQWTPEGLQIWRQNSDEAPSYLPLYENAHVLSQLEDGRIITQTMEGGLSDSDSYIRLWTEQEDRTWISCLLGQYSLNRIFAINNHRIVLYNSRSFIVLTEVGDQWIPSNHVSIPEDHRQDNLHVLKNGQIVTTGESFKNSRGALIWKEHQNQWYPESLLDENGIPIIFDHVIMLQDGRWVSWSDNFELCELRIWAYIDGHYSSTLLSGLSWAYLADSSRSSRLIWAYTYMRYYSNPLLLSKHSKVFELPGGWLAAVSSIPKYSNVKVWNLFPERGKLQK
ncbi:hypothetical protein [Endozoicomonas montiporae]|nr:hypothetical protein [Endozoicomonas montiporae]